MHDGCTCRSHPHCSRNARAVPSSAPVTCWNELTRSDSICVLNIEQARPSPGPRMYNNSPPPPLRVSEVCAPAPPPAAQQHAAARAAAQDVQSSNDPEATLAPCSGSVLCCCCLCCCVLCCCVLCCCSCTALVHSVRCLLARLMLQEMGEYSTLFHCTARVRACSHNMIRMPFMYTTTEVLLNSKSETPKARRCTPASCTTPPSLRLFQMPPPHIVPPM